MYLDTSDARIWFDDDAATQSRASLVFLHPGTGSSEIWRPQTAVFRQEGFRCVAYDARGSGRSLTSRTAADGSDDVNDLSALVDHLRLDRVVLVGAALGGFAALEYASLHPDRLAGLVIANSIGGLDDQEYRSRIERAWTPGIRSLSPAELELSPGYRADNPDGVRAWTDIHDRALPAGAPNRSLAYRNTPASLGRITVPTTFICGDADLLAPPALMRDLAACVSGAQVSVVPETGHASFWERPDETNDVLRAALNRFLRK